MASGYWTKEGYWVPTDWKQVVPPHTWPSPGVLFPYEDPLWPKPVITYTPKLKIAVVALKTTVTPWKVHKDQFTSEASALYWFEDPENPYDQLWLATGHYVKGKNAEGMPISKWTSLGLGDLIDTPAWKSVLVDLDLAGGIMMSEQNVMPIKQEVPIAVKQTTEMVNVPLDMSEQVKLGQAIANMMVQVEHLKDELKKTVTEQRGHINALKGTIREHAKTLSKGYAQELASVEHHLDFNTESVKVMYKGKLLKDRPMTDEEKQLDLEVCLSMGMELKAPKPVTKVALKGG